MLQTTIKNLKKGHLFRLVDNQNASLWVRSEYNRTDKKYECYRYEDVNHIIFCNAKRRVWI